MALGGLRFLRDHNIAVPEEVGVVGFDDIEAAKLVGLTTMEQFIAKKAEIAITYLKGRLSGELTQPQNDELSITPRIVVRGTTK
jgi:LacI family transcriptional regulator, repressor for deo operon, udp, cdd, tsx, nupC, and nupG